MTYTISRACRGHQQRRLRLLVPLWWLLAITWPCFSTSWRCGPVPSEAQDCQPSMSRVRQTLRQWRKLTETSRLPPRDQSTQQPATHVALFRLSGSFYTWKWWVLDSSTYTLTTQHRTSANRHPPTNNISSSMPNQTFPKTKDNKEKGANT